MRIEPRHAAAADDHRALDHVTTILHVSPAAVGCYKQGMQLLRALGIHRARVAWFAVSTAMGGGCDLHTKDWAERALEGASGQSIMVFDPWLEFSLAYNRGTAFSLVRDLGETRWFFAALALVVILGLFWSVIRSHCDRLDALCFGAIAGGALGNGIDRAFRAAPGGGTGVVDFIKLNYPWGGSWPTFNVADVLIAVGVAVLIGRRLFQRSNEPARPTEAATG